MSKTKYANFHWNPDDYVRKKRLIVLVKAWRAYATRTLKGIKRGDYSMSSQADLTVIIQTAKTYRKAAESLMRLLK